MRVLLFAACAALTLTACGGGEKAEENNMMAEDANMMMTDDANMMTDANMMNGTMDANMATDPATQNMMQQDMNSNAPDTNLANGM